MAISRRGWAAGALLLAASLAAITSCATSGQVPARTDPNSALLIIAAENKMQNSRAQMQAAVDAYRRPITSFLFLGELEERVAELSIDPAVGPSLIILPAGNYTLQRISLSYEYQDPTGGMRGGSTSGRNSVVEARDLEIPFTLAAGEATVFPYKFVYVTVNEDRNGIGTIALKMRPLTEKEQADLATVLEAKGLKAFWSNLRFEGGARGERLFPLPETQTGEVVIARKVSPEYPPVEGNPVVSPAAAAPVPSPPAATPGVPAPAAPRAAATAPAAPTPARPAAKARLAVLDFRNTVLPEDEARVLVDLLTSTLSATPKFTILERSQIEKIVKEHEFSQSAMADTSKQVEVGRLLSASYVVVGSIGRVGTRYVMDARVIDVQTGETRAAASVIRGNTDELVLGVKQLGADLSAF
jgi:TolB-like protein